MDTNQLIVDIATKVVYLLLILVGNLIRVWLTKSIEQGKLNQALEIAEIAVKATEAIAATKGWNSKDKLNNALLMAREFAEKYGVKFKDEEWRVLIEQAVLILKSNYEELKKDG